LKQAETLRTQAQAEGEAKKMRAEGAKAEAAAAGLAAAEIQKAQADAAMREAEAIKAKGLAEAESEKARAEALAAYDGVAQRVELMKLELDARVRIETAKAQSLGQAMAAMNIKLIGDPAAAASLLRMVTLADGLGEIVKATPAPVREVGQQLLNKATGSNGNALLRFAEAGEDESRSGGVSTLAQMLPQLLALTERTLDINNLKGLTVTQVAERLRKAVKPEDQALVERAQAALSELPIIADMPFEDVYLRAK
jgi:hypothetical protein